MEKTPILYVSHLRKYFDVNKGLKRSAQVRALDDVSFTLMKGETIGIVGETGCGKTTLGRTILRLTQATDGDVYFGLDKDLMNEIIETDKQYHQSMLKHKETPEATDDLKELREKMESFRNKYSITAMRSSDIKKFRKMAQPVFQDPFSSLDPKKLIKDIVAEPLKNLTKLSRKEIMDIERSLIGEIGLSEDHLYRFPHEFSGGQRQRIGIMRAIAIQPDLLVLDEPTSALDVSVQAQILNILKDIQEKRQISYVFISHHLHVIRMMADKVAIMYLGKLVELADTETLFSSMLHPYTRALLSAIPIPDPDIKRKRIELEGDIPNPSNPPRGCYFHPRCPVAMENCGWTPQDFGDSILNVFNEYSNPEVSKLPVLEDVILDQPNMEIRMKFNEVLTEEHLNLINSFIQEASMKEGGVKYKSFSEISKESNYVTIKLKQYDTPDLKEVRPGHFVSCLIYEDESNVGDQYAETESSPENTT